MPVTVSTPAPKTSVEWLKQIEEELMKTRNGRVAAALLEINNFELRSATTSSFPDKMTDSIHIAKYEIDLIANRAKVSTSQAAALVITKVIQEYYCKDKLPPINPQKVLWHQKLYGKACGILPDGDGISACIKETFDVLSLRFPSMVNTRREQFPPSTY